MPPRFRPALTLVLAVSAALTAPAPLAASPEVIGHLRLERTTLEVSAVSSGYDAPFDLAWLEVDSYDPAALAHARRR